MNRQSLAAARSTLVRARSSCALAVQAVGLTLVLSIAAAGASLSVSPQQIRLTDIHDGRQLIVTVDGVDVTRAAHFESRQPAVAKADERGFVSPAAEGQTSILISHRGAQVELPVEVARLDRNRPIDYQNEIIPLLTRYGCNAGGCHGKASGQNGFKLSLFGFDPVHDYQAMAVEGRGRRVSPGSPEHSLLVRKAAGLMPHGGSARFAVGSEPYHILVDWIAQGLPQVAAQPREIERIDLPAAQWVSTVDGGRQLSVQAVYSDGTRRDVTRQAQYESNLDAVAVVDPQGFVETSGAHGEAAIMVRYQSKVAIFRVIVPHGPPRDSIPNFAERNYVDHLSAEKWKKLGLLPSPPTDDGRYLRRVSIDLCGRLPTVAETQAFLSDTEPDKRDKAVDRLLASPDYAAFFALRWGSILRNSPKASADQAAYAFHNWIKDMIGRNRPYDEFVRGIVAASGEWQDAPAVNWYWQMRDDQLHQVVADTAQVFLGLRLQCAKCHHHPYERYSQGDYYGLAGFFMRVGRKSFGQPPPYFASPTKAFSDINPQTGQPAEPKYLDGEAAKFGPLEDPRQGLVDWMVRPDNPYFARALVNRLWGHFFGRGLVEPVDDLRETNPPSNPELLDALARDFVEHKLDVKHMIRTLVTSNVYALSTEPIDDNRDDRQNFARYYSRRMIAEVFLDATDEACGSKTKFNGVASTARAVDLPHENFYSYFLDAFNRPRRESGCECERSASGTLSQVLLLANSDEVEGKVGDGNGRISLALKANKSDSDIVTDLYLAGFSRYPSPDELAKAIGYVTAAAPKRQQALEDVLWALLNSKEFSYNH